MRIARALVGLAGPFLFVLNATRAQAPATPAPQKLEFEVASVKRLDPKIPCCYPPQIDPGIFVYKTTLHNLIGQAYRAFFRAPRKIPPETALFREHRRGSTRTILPSRAKCQVIFPSTQGPCLCAAARRRLTRCFRRS